MVGQEAEVSVWGDEGQDSLGLPALEPDTGVEAHIVQQSRVLQDHRCRNNMLRKGIWDGLVYSNIE